MDRREKAKAYSAFCTDVFMTTAEYARDLGTPPAELLVVLAFTLLSTARKVGVPANVLLQAVKLAIDTADAHTAANEVPDEAPTEEAA